MGEVIGGNEPGTLFYVLCGLWALAILALLVKAIRLSYRIEARSPELSNRTGLPMRAKILHTAANWKVARDPETQELRRRMNLLLMTCISGVALMAIGINWVKAG
ncbi:MAG: hypothetical protein WBA44_18370 [Mesorhizobium sp.]